ncbi:hypothetical protein AYL99_10752 [Fonsecaea erecta]|uniref:Uncharacterized protein n=1 Tax=Fonsecaea erecta TaxID=1367422 RepID=A0A178Z5R2_9EURO|nr:hypothetical protein AYL99_10752 [Fonsecaea erecta]OAP55052.1 hypothetical protein AYL99_10752 [Fonsecaea erecta]
MASGTHADGEIGLSLASSLQGRGQDQTDLFHLCGKLYHKRGRPPGSPSPTVSFELGPKEAIQLSSVSELDLAHVGSQFGIARSVPTPGICSCATSHKSKASWMAAKL